MGVVLPSAMERFGSSGCCGELPRPHGHVRASRSMRRIKVRSMWLLTMVALVGLLLGCFYALAPGFVAPEDSAPRSRGGARRRGGGRLRRIREEEANRRNLLLAGITGVGGSLLVEPALSWAKEQDDKEESTKKHVQLRPSISFDLPVSEEFENQKVENADPQRVALFTKADGTTVAVGPIYPEFLSNLKKAAERPGGEQTTGVKLVNYQPPKYRPVPKTMPDLETNVKLEDLECFETGTCSVAAEAEKSEKQSKLEALKPLVDLLPQTLSSNAHYWMRAIHSKLGSQLMVIALPEEKLLQEKTVMKAVLDSFTVDI